MKSKTDETTRRDDFWMAVVIGLGMICAFNIVQQLTGWRVVWMFVGLLVPGVLTWRVLTDGLPTQWWFYILTMAFAVALYIFAP